MVRRWGLFAFIFLLVPAALACQKETAVTREVTDDDLRAMVLQAQDLPAGFSLHEEKLSNNEDYAQDFKEPEDIRGKVEDWGRAAGFENTFATAGSPARVRLPSIVNSAAERFSDAGHARDAWKGQEGLVPHAKTAYTAPARITGPQLGDQSAAMRMFLTDERGTEMVVYWAYFRKGNVLASVSTAAPTYRDDRGDHAFRLAKLVAERVDARLK